jgi:hypothetical protein
MIDLRKQKLSVFNMSHSLANLLFSFIHLLCFIVREAMIKPVRDRT